MHKKRRRPVGRRLKLSEEELLAPHQGCSWSCCDGQNPTTSKLRIPFRLKRTAPEMVFANDEQSACRLVSRDEERRSVPYGSPAADGADAAAFPRLLSAQDVIEA